jgi:hypothetical protein
LWQLFQLPSIDGISVDLSPHSDSIRLASLTFISPSQPHRGRNEVSLLSLGSSHVLLAAISTASTPEIVLLLWDLQYSVLLASHTLPIPSNLSHSKDSNVHLDLIAANSVQALLVLSPTRIPDTKSHTSSAPSRSSVLVVPFAVPATSTIANAMGRAEDGLKWLDRASSSPQPNPPDIGSDREKLLDTMRTAMEQNRPAIANAAFFEWERVEMARLQNPDQAIGKSGKATRVRAALVFSVGYAEMCRRTLILRLCSAMNLSSNFLILFFSPLNLPMHLTCTTFCVTFFRRTPSVQI